MLVVMLFGSVAEATHFRFGTIAWSVPDPVGAPLTVRFVVQHAWRSGAANAVALSPRTGVTLPATLGTLIGVGTGLFLGWILVGSLGQGISLNVDWGRIGLIALAGVSAVRVALTLPKVDANDCDCA